MFDQSPDPTLAAEACCKLIHAYLAGHESVEWSDVQEALNAALKAFDLPPTFIEDRADQNR